MALLEVKGVGKSFGALRALDDVNLEVRAGTFHGLIGPNGSGKSTLLKAIAGAHFADRGGIVFGGQDITKATPYERARAGMSLKFQITAVLPSLSVYDNVLLALQAQQGLWSLLRSATRKSLHAEVMQSLARFRLHERSVVLSGELSHGETQWLVLLDLTMPVMTGRQFLEVRGNDPVLAGTPVIVMTAADDCDELVPSQNVSRCLPKTAPLS